MEALALDNDVVGGFCATVTWNEHQMVRFNFKINNEDLINLKLVYDMQGYAKMIIRVVIKKALYKQKFIYNLIGILSFWCYDGQNV